jgi:hypothetical protein
LYPLLFIYPVIWPWGKIWPWTDWANQHEADWRRNGFQEFGTISIPNFWLVLYMEVSYNGGFPNSWMVYKGTSYKNGWFGGTSF